MNWTPEAVPEKIGYSPPPSWRFNGAIIPNVDAICFWMVWDAQKAALEVQDYRQAVSWSAQAWATGNWAAV